MKTIKLIFTLISFVIANYVSGNNLTSDKDKIKTNSQINECKRCDKKAIEKVAEDFDKLTNEDIKKFLCTFNEECDLTELYKKSGGTYEQIAFEMLIALFDKYFNNYIEIIENNQDINIDYLLILFSKPAIDDLPQRQILRKLEGMKTRTILQEKIYKAFDRGVKDGDLRIKETK